MIWWFIPDSAPPEQWLSATGFHVHDVYLLPIWDKCREKCKVCDITTQTQNKWCSWQKRFCFPAQRGSFFHELIANPRTKGIGGLPMWHKHIWRSVRRKRKKKKSKPKSQHQGRKMSAVFLPSYNASFMSMRWFAEWVCINRSLSGSWFAASCVCSNYKPENIHKECFRIMGHSVKMDVGLITNIKTSYCQCATVYHIFLCWQYCKLKSEGNSNYPIFCN